MTLRLKRDRRGVSNIIIVVLSLVIIVAIISNIVLWNYEMNQLDWERMREDMSVTNVERLTHSSWFVAQSEYKVSFGTRVNGTYEDTQITNDGRWETFQENISYSSSFFATISGGTGTNVQNLKAEPDDNYATLIAPPLGLGTQDAYGTGFETGTNEINKVNIIAQYHVSEAASNDELTLKYSLDGGATYGFTSETIIPTSTEDVDWGIDVTVDRTWTWSNISALSVWLSYSRAGADDGATVYADALWVVVQFSYSYRLDFNSTFVIDVSSYSLDSIQTVEIQLSYRADDASEKWYLKALNWSSSTYSDKGFNFTAGHTPTAGWDYYAVNLTDAWRSYVQDNGTLHVRFVDHDADSNRTAIEIDFLGVRAEIDGTRFTFKNGGALTSHLVSLWIINSTDHQRYDINVFVNSGETTSYLRADISLPKSENTVRVVTERGNTAVYSGI